MPDQNYQESHKIYQIVLSLHKKDSSFLYFTFESNEGLCFYSTNPNEVGATDREVVINVLPEFVTHVESILSQLEAKFPINYLSREWITDK